MKAGGRIYIYYVLLLVPAGATMRSSLAALDFPWQTDTPLHRHTPSPERFKKKIATQKPSTNINNHVQNKHPPPPATLFPPTRIKSCRTERIVTVTVTVAVTLWKSPHLPSLFSLFHLFVVTHTPNKHQQSTSEHPLPPATPQNKTHEIMPPNRSKR